MQVLKNGKIVLDKMSLKEARSMRGITQEDLSMRLGVHRHTYANWEENPKSMSIETAEKICKELNLPFSKIFFG